MDCSPPGPSVHGILQARILEWAAIPFSKGSAQLRDQTSVSCIAGRFINIWANSDVSLQRNLERKKLSCFPSRIPWGQWWSRKQWFLTWDPGRTPPLFTWLRAISWARGGPEKVPTLWPPSTHPPFPVPSWRVILWFNLPGFLWG